jgi:pimeloyl-ACP methyl ester carboxylesterase/DNA-binding CsgD family transcriptional regulator
MPVRETLWQTKPPYIAHMVYVQYLFLLYTWAMKLDDDISLQNYASLIDLIYEAAAKPELWPELLAELSTYLDVPDDASHENLKSQHHKNDLLEPHITRAIGLNQRIMDLETKHHTIEQILNRIPIGVIVTNADAMPLAMNNRAQTLLDAKRCLILKNGVLTAKAPKQNRTLSRLIHRHAHSQGNTKGSIIQLQTQQGGLDNITSLWLSTAGEIPHTNSNEKHLCIIYIASPLIRPSYNIESIQQSFGLTPAEARLVKTLANGCHNLNEAAESLGISIHTARSQIKTIFEKTNTNSQLELIKRILTSPSVIFGESQPLKVIHQHTEDEHLQAYQSLRLHDGRIMSYAEYGDPKGEPVVFCHAVAGSRLQYPRGDTLAATLGLRIIVPDRPGIGYSDMKNDYTLLDWSQDLTQLVNHLNINTFAIIGYSGGSPYAMACAYSMPDRIHHLSLVSAIGPIHSFKNILKIDSIILQLARYTPKLLKHYLQIMIADIRQDPIKRLYKRFKHYHQTDRDCIEQHPEQQAMYAEALLESIRQGASGITQDIIASTRPWGFKPSDIHVNIDFWHGKEDVAFPLESAKKLAHDLPHCHTHFINNIGSTVIIHQWKAILTNIARKTTPSKQDRALHNG